MNSLDKRRNPCIIYVEANERSPVMFRLFGYLVAWFADQVCAGFDAYDERAIQREMDARVNVFIDSDSDNTFNMRNPR
jgi:hypothetical protein